MNFDLPLDSVVAECIFRCEEAEGGWFDHRSPPPEFGAESAIAFRGSLFVKIDVYFVFDCAAMTAAVVRFAHFDGVPRLIRDRKKVRGGNAGDK